MAFDSDSGAFGEKLDDEHARDDQGQTEAGKKVGHLAV